MTCLRAIVPLTAAALASGCINNATAVSNTPAKLRIVNSLYQYTDSNNTAAGASARSIDVLIDSSMAPPGIGGLAPNSMSTDAPAGYRAIAVGLHSFVVRVSGQTASGTSVFRIDSATEYLPKQYLTPSTPYTLVVAGIVPAVGHPDSTAVPYTVLVDDPFAPPKIGGVYQARFRVINAAPFADPGGQGAVATVYVTPGTTARPLVPGDTTAQVVSYRGATPYMNRDAGTYVLTIATGPTGTENVLYQQTVTFGAGEVRTFIFQSTGYASTPGMVNHQVTVLLDHEW